MPGNPFVNTMTRSSPLVSLAPLLTPWAKAVSVEPGPVDGGILSKLRGADFDQAPVVHRGKPLGIVLTAHLDELHATGRPLEPTSSFVGRGRIGISPSIDDLLAAIAEQRGAIIGEHEDESPGFVTLSDLNRHHFKAALYPMFAELEAGLAELVAVHFAEPWDWLKALDKDRQARLVGYWELSKRDGVDIGPLAGTMLSELSEIGASSEPIRRRLGFESKSLWKSTFDGISGLRNAIMHPVRPMIHDVDDVKQLKERVAKMLTVLGRMDSEVAR